MAKKRRLVKEQAPAPAGAYEKAETILAFLERHAGWIAIIAVLFASARIVATYHVFNHTSDEPAHIGAGMEWLDKGRYTWEAQHPPLARAAVALGPYLLGARAENGDHVSPLGMSYEGLRILYFGHHYDLTLALSRLGVLPFFWIASLVVYEWGRRDFNRAIGAMAVSIFTFIPTVLAHAGLATTDIALTAGLGAAFLTGMIWVRQPTPAKAAVFGLCGALAVLSKFSSLAFFPAAVAVTFLWYYFSQRPASGDLFRSIWQRMPTLALAAFVCAMVVWAGYRFSVGKVGFANISLPAPEFYAGLKEVQKHNTGGHPSFLLGQRGTLGWWYFFPVALSVKTPLALLILVGVAMFLVARRKFAFREYAPTVSFAAGILFVAMASTINIGLRHILPIYMAFSMLAAMAASWMLERGMERRGFALSLALLAAWFAGSSLISHPDYLPYFNELAGSHPENILVDSDLDWGQDMKRLSARLKELGVTEVTLLTPFLGDFEKEHGIPHRLDKMNVFYPSPGWTAISVTYWKEHRLSMEDKFPNRTVWPDLFPPTEKAGKGIFMWYFPQGTVR